MNINIICIFILVMLLSLPVSAFEDTFQYYPGGDASSNWNFNTYASIGTFGGTFSRNIYIYHNAGGTSGKGGTVTNVNSFGTDYLSFNIRIAKITTTGGCVNIGDPLGNHDGVGSGNCDITIRIYDTNNNVIGSYVVLKGTGRGETGLYEFTVSSGQLLLRINGNNMGSLGSTSDQIGFVLFHSWAYNNAGGGNAIGTFVIDDVSTDGYVVGIGTESTIHDVTEANSNETNISFTINSFPFADFTVSQYNLSVKRFGGSSFVELQNNAVKDSGNTTPFAGMVNYTRDIDLTNNDTSYGLYWAFLQQDGVNKANDYFFFQPPGTTSTVSFTNSEIVAGTNEVISYNIGSFDAGVYNYFIKVISLTDGELFSQQVSSASGSVTWDSTDASTGQVFAVISQITKADGTYNEIAFDVSTVSTDSMIKGYTFNGRDNTSLGNVLLNWTQGTTQLNTSSNISTGYYQQTGLVTGTEININSSFTNFTHDNFTFTPPTPSVYVMNLYLFPTNDTQTNGLSVIEGMTVDNPLRQSVGSATVTITNGTWNSTITSNGWGYYNFTDLTPGTYYIISNKTGFQNSNNFTVVTTANTTTVQMLPMYEIFTVTVKARDNENGAFIFDFDAQTGSQTNSTTTGSLAFDLTFGLHTFSVTATNYFAGSTSTLIDSDETVTVTLTRESSQFFAPHMVKFQVRTLFGTKFQNIATTVMNASSNDVIFTGITGTDGAVTFELDEDFRYRITFVNASQGINEDITLYPKDEFYYVIVEQSSDVYNEFQQKVLDSLSTTVTKTIINSTHAYINVTYIDSTNLTTNLSVFINQSNISDPANQTIISQQFATGNTSNAALSFVVSPYSGEDFLVNFKATHTTYGTYNKLYGVAFKSKLIFDGIPDIAWTYLAVIVIVLTGAAFPSSLVHFGGIIICAETWIFLLVGTLDELPGSETTKITALTIATVFSVIYAMSQHNKREGFA